MLTIAGGLKAHAIIVQDKMSTRPLIILPAISFDFMASFSSPKKILPQDYSTNFSHVRQSSAQNPASYY